MMKVFLDSCVILSRLPRILLIEAGKQSAIEICYSQSVEDESLHVARRKGMERDIAGAFVELQLYGRKSPSAEERLDLWLPDENDRHVVLGALGAGADRIATENLRDFPRAALEPVNLSAQSPDQILCSLLLNNKINLELSNFSELKRAKLYRTAKYLKQKLNEDGGNRA